MSTRNVKPQLAVAQVQDQYIRKNFEALRDYFNTQNQFQDFQFQELVFSGAVTNQQVAHTLGVIPQDIILTKITGPGTVTFNHGSFTNQYLSISTTGACRVRFFFGSYLGFQSSVQNAASDTTSYSSTAPAAAAFYSGMFMYWPTATPPTGWILYVDTALSKATYPNLFAIFGTKYSQSGDAAGTFRLPPGVARTVVMAGSSPLAVSGTNSSTPSAKTAGAFGGEETHLLKSTETGLPVHGHGGATSLDHQHITAINTPNNAGAGVYGSTSLGSASVMWGQNAGATFAQWSSGVISGLSYTVPNATAQDASTAHNILQPYTVWYGIIKT